MKQKLPSESEISSLDQFANLSFFADIEIGLAAAGTINNAMDQVMDKIGEIFSPVHCAMMLCDHESDELYVKLASGPAADKMKNLRLPKQEGVAGWILENGEPLLIEDACDESLHSPRWDDLTGSESRTIIGAPLKVDGKVIGAIILCDRRNQESYKNNDLTVLSTIAEYASVTIEKVYYLSAIKDLAKTDPVTGVNNRRQIDVIIQREIERCKRYGPILAMVKLDIDNLKGINDKLGNAAGDQVLKRTAQIMRSNIRKIDVLGRYDDDEFIILLPHTKKHEAENVRQRIYRDVEQENQNNQDLPFTVTMGLHAEGPDKVDGLQAEVDNQLLREKRRLKRKKPREKTAKSAEKSRKKSD